MGRSGRLRVGGAARQRNGDGTETAERRDWAIGQSEEAARWRDGLMLAGRGRQPGGSAMGRWGKCAMVIEGEKCAVASAVAVTSDDAGCGWLTMLMAWIF